MDYYTILGLAPGASVSDVKRAYRRLSRRYHPRINPGDRAAESLFRQITEAYETLVDANRRQQYDSSGAVAAGETAKPFEFSGFDFSVKAYGAQAATFSELFAEALHPVPPQDRGAPRRGADLHATVSIPFLEAMQGVERQVVITRQVLCSACRGSGHERVSDVRCTHCHGAGRVRWARGHMVFTKDCAACDATGLERHRRCAVCAGQGRSVRSEAVVVRVPAGVLDGVQLRVAERGHAGANGAPAGDLYIHVKVQPHPVLRREHDDLHMVVPVAVHEAALGARIEVPSYDGPVRLRIPPGTQAGQRFRVSGRGAPSRIRQAADGRSEARGDLWIEVRIVLPPIVDERSKELMREFARLNPADVRQELVERVAMQELS
jgi:molecular chaperone DnaJ